MNFEENTAYAESENMGEFAESPVNDSNELSENNLDTATPDSDGKVEEPSRDYEKDAAFAQMRREKEAAERERDEAIAREQARREAITRLTGSEDGDIHAIAEANGEDYEDVNSAFNAYTESIEKDKKISDLQSQLDEVNAERRLQQDLVEAQALDPSIKDLDELGPTFFELKAKGVSTESAYWAAKAEKEAKQFKAPKPPGKANADKPEKDHYTEAEWDAMTPEQQSANWEKGMASMKYW